MAVVRYVSVAGAILAEWRDAAYRWRILDPTGRVLALRSADGSISRVSPAGRPEIPGARLPRRAPAPGRRDGEAGAPTESAPLPPRPLVAPVPAVARAAAPARVPTVMVEPFLLAGELALRLVGEARGVLFRAGADRELLAEALGRLYLWIVAELEREPEGHLSPLALGRRAIRRHARNAVRAERQVRFREVSLGALETGEEGSELPACATAGDPTADPVLERVWLNQILAGLPAHQRKVAEDCLAGKAYEEIAAARGVSLQAVRQLWLRTAGRLGADAEKKPGRVQNRRSE